MTNATLIFRSLIVIILLAGFAHLFSYTSRDKLPKEVQESISTDAMEANTDTISLIGKWKVTYNSEEYKGSIIYDLKKEGKEFNAYTFEYEDEKGYTATADGSKVLAIHEFNGKAGNGIYYFEHENEEYEVNCQIDLIDENSFRLSYDYYGYAGVETWKRQ